MTPDAHSTIARGMASGMRIGSHAGISSNPIGGGGAGLAENAVVDLPIPAHEGPGGTGGVRAESVVEKDRVGARGTTQELTILEPLELKFKPGTAATAIARTRRIQTENGVLAAS